MTYQEWLEWQREMTRHEAELRRRKALRLPPFDVDTN